MQIKPGDVITRNYCGIEMKLGVIDVLNGRIITMGGWEFDLETGLEIDELCEWGPAFGKSGSFIKEIVDENRRLQS